MWGSGPDGDNLQEARSLSYASRIVMGNHTIEERQRMHKIPLAATVVLGILISTAQATQAQGKAVEDRRLQCMACHAGPGRVTYDPETGKKQDIRIRMDEYHAGDHGGTHCLECHEEGFEMYPHSRMRTNTCMECHPREGEGAEDDEPYEFKRIEDEYEETVHYTEYKDKEEYCCGTSPAARERGAMVRIGRPEEERFTCEHCHDPHYFKSTEQIGEAQSILENDNGPCLECHEDDAKGPLQDPAEPSMKLAHDYLPHIAMHLENTRCIDCHTTVTRETVTHDLPEGARADQGCNTCHSIDSIMMRRLYRYEVEPGKTLGFHNAAMLADSYTMGAHRHRMTDWAAFVLVGLSIFVILLHAGLRLVRSR